MPTPPGLRELQRQATVHLFGRMVRYRVVALPAVVALFLLVAWLDPTPWRRWFMVAASGSLSVFFVLEAWRFRRWGFGPSSVPVNLALAVVGQLGITFATGGVESPFLLIAVVLSFLSGIFVPRPLLQVLIGAQIASAWGFAWLAVHEAIPGFNPSFFGGGPRAGHSDGLLWTLAALATFVYLIASKVGRGGRGVFEATIRRAATAQKDALVAHAERAEELSALSGEIAHELKNPLASVKGLAGLLEKNVDEGKGVERLSVLRREVDRMQGILDEFLNFSRPLVPLEAGTVDLDALCREVAALHEGLAHQRDVALSVRAQGARAHGDPRKLKQVLINLVQNALDAGGDEVELVAEAVPSGAAGAAPAGAVRVRVLDRGRGLDPQLSARIFEPGVTGKARGSGLGLTIARALARQHGGELTLQDREGGGCVAELTLPTAEAARPTAASTAGRDEAVSAEAPRDAAASAGAAHDDAASAEAPHDAVEPAEAPHRPDGEEVA